MISYGNFAADSWYRTRILPRCSTTANLDTKIPRDMCCTSEWTTDVQFMNIHFIEIYVTRNYNYLYLSWHFTIHTS